MERVLHPLWARVCTPYDSYITGKTINCYLIDYIENILTSILVNIIFIAKRFHPRWKTHILCCCCRHYCSLPLYQHWSHVQETLDMIKDVTLMEHTESVQRLVYLIHLSGSLLVNNRGVKLEVWRVISLYVKGDSSVIKFPWIFFKVDSLEKT